jgi:hypothetical protein
VDLAAGSWAPCSRLTLQPAAGGGGLRHAAWGGGLRHAAWGGLRPAQLDAGGLEPGAGGLVPGLGLRLVLGVLAGWCLRLGGWGLLGGWRVLVAWAAVGGRRQEGWGARVRR